MKMRMEPTLEKYVRKGLKALKKSDRNLFRVGGPTPLSSLNIESAHKDTDYHKRFHNSPLWDYYLLLYKRGRRVFYLEAHPARVDQIERVLKKAEWLRQRADHDEAMPSTDNRPLFWIPAGSVKISATSIEAHLLADKKIHLLLKSQSLADFWD